MKDVGHGQSHPPCDILVSVVEWVLSKGITLYMVKGSSDLLPIYKLFHEVKGMRHAPALGLGTSL